MSLAWTWGSWAGAVHGAPAVFDALRAILLERRLANVRASWNRSTPGPGQALEEVVVELEQKLDASRGESPPSGSSSRHEGRLAGRMVQATGKCGERAATAAVCCNCLPHLRHDNLASLGLQCAVLAHHDARSWNPPP